MDGWPVQLRVWLTDGQTEAMLTAPSGVALGDVRLAPTARQLGAWHLYARATDVCGVVAQTGLVRSVTVVP